MTPAPAGISSALRGSLVLSYEDLRQIALVPGAQAGGTGLALFIRNGMARWMEVCIELFNRLPMPNPPQLRDIQQRFDPDIRLEVSVVLAQMALSAHDQEAKER